MIELKEKKLRGFAAMSKDRLREISSRGGSSVDPTLRSFFVNRQLASSAGQLGGISVDPSLRAFSKDHNLAIKAGHKGGLAKNKANQKM